MSTETLHQQTFEKLGSLMSTKMHEIVQAVNDRYPVFDVSEPCVAGTENPKVFVDLRLDNEFALGLDLVLVNGDDCTAQTLLRSLTMQPSSPESRTMAPVGFTLRLDVQGYADEYLGCYSPCWDHEPTFTKDLRILKKRLSLFSAKDLLDFLGSRVITRERFPSEIVNSRRENNTKNQFFV